LPPLEPGDHLDRKTFHDRYEAMSGDVRAELIGGIVFMPSPLQRRHGRCHPLLTRWLDEYEQATPGVALYDSASALLGDDSEPQPDLSLLIEPERGGQTQVDEDDYIVGAPELVIEVASSTEAYDLHNKKRDYEKYGAKEYLVAALRQQQVFWFISRAGKFEPLDQSGDGILRSATFPGLWLDPAALLRRDRDRVLEILHQGLKSAEHAAFVTRLSR
jgi:Uma2 family endonuclease